MTRKDYKVVAAAIAQVRRDFYVNQVNSPSSDAINAALAGLENKLCVAFRADNPRFSNVKFVEACRET